MKLLFILICLMCVIPNANAQQIAFPGAEGYGKFATGGRGTIAAPPRIFIVTKLDDDGSVGTFRYACTNNSPVAASRIIIFRVAGTIHLTSALSLNRANTTIAGQTAPGGGICVADFPVTINANNMIIRYLRFRLGDKNQAASFGDHDAFGDNGGGRQRIIIDHCSISWSNDEDLTVYKGDSVTLQWNFITEPLDYSYHVEGGVTQRHGYGGIQSGRHTSIHHNLYAHIRGRMPRFDGIRSGNPDTADYRNNVLYNWADYTVNGGEGGAYNIVNNFYKYGLNTSAGSSNGAPKMAMIINPYKAAPIPYGKYFLTGNYTDGNAAVTANNWFGAAMNGGTYADTLIAKSDTELNCSLPINIQTAQEAYELVLRGAGTTLPLRDTLDDRIVLNVRNRTGRLIDTQGGFPGYPTYTPYSITQVAWPTLPAGFVPADSDLDGMPDAWEAARGLNPNSAADANSAGSTTGYSNIETFLNGDTITAPGVLNTCVTAKRISTSGAGGWVFARDTTRSAWSSPTYVSSTDSNSVVASVLNNNNFGAFDVSYFTTDVLRTDPSTSKKYLNRNVTIVPADPALITAPVTVRLYISQKEFDDLRAADPAISSISDLNILRLSSNNCGGNLAGGYTVITPIASGVFGSYSKGYYLEFRTSMFSTFYIAAIQNIVVPLKLTSFDAVLRQKEVEVSWETSNEVNTSFFTIEKSADARQFTGAGNVPATNAAGGHRYTFSDNEPLRGVSFYRLKTTDVSGEFSYSTSKKIINSAVTNISLYPDPVRDRLTVVHTAVTNPSSIRIIGSSGAAIARYEIATGTTTSTLDVSSLAAGTYTLIFDAGNGGTASKMFIRIQ